MQEKDEEKKESHCMRGKITKKSFLIQLFDLIMSRKLRNVHGTVEREFRIYDPRSSLTGHHRPTSEKNYGEKDGGEK